MNFSSILKYDPLPGLLNSGDAGLSYFTRRDLLNEPVKPVETLWELPEAKKIIAHQQPDGSWKSGVKENPSVPGENYSLLETFRNLRLLVEMYGFTRNSPVIENATSYCFHCRSPEGDIRGIIGNQYMPYYFGAILELLIKAGEGDDPRVIAGLDWLLAMRQEDGGWIVPTQAVPSARRTSKFWAGDPVQPDRSLPHAHLATGMVLRSFAAHPAYRERTEVQTAGICLKSRLLAADKYNDRKSPDYWLKLQFPFWWTSLVSALDTLSLLNFPLNDPEIQSGLNWFIRNQNSDGFWPTGYDKGSKTTQNRLWVGLAVCRIFHRYYS